MQIRYLNKLLVARVFFLWVYICAIFFLANNSYSADAGKNHGHDIDHQVDNSCTDAKSILSYFLQARIDGQYEKYQNFVTKRLNDHLKQTYGVNIANFFKTSEEHYKTSKIVKEMTHKDNIIIITVVSRVEGPGYFSDKYETYYMVLENGAWKIDDWVVKEKLVQD